MANAPSSSTVSAQYPADLFPPDKNGFIPWMLFEVKSGRHVLRSGTLDISGTADRTIKSVALYLPMDALSSTLTANWESSDLGVAGAGLERAFQTMGTSTPGRSGAVPVKQGAAEDIIPALAGGAVAGVATAGLNKLMSEIGGKSEQAVAAAQSVTGLTPNPRTDVLFKSVQYRTHSFTFQLVPRNKTEADAIDSILNIFQFYMLPSFGDLAFIGYPYEFEISMFSQKNGSHHINTIDRSVLTECSINHAPSDRVSFVHDGEYYPTATTLRLSFQEVRLQGRDKQYSIWRGLGDGEGGVDTGKVQEGFGGDLNDPSARTKDQ